MISPEESREFLMMMGFIIALALVVFGIIRGCQHIYEKFPRFSRAIGWTFVAIWMLVLVGMFGIIILRACEFI